MKVPENLTGLETLVIEDGYNTSYKGMASATDSRVNALGEADQITVTAGGSGLKEGKDADYTVTTSYSAMLKGLNKGTTPLVRIEMNQNVLGSLAGKKVTVTYSTAFDESGMTANVEYHNYARAWFNTVSREADSKVESHSALISKSGEGSDSNGLMSWDIQATTSIEKGSTIEDSWTDQSPMKLVKGSFKINGTTLPESSFVTVNADGNGFSIDLD